MAVDWMPMQNALTVMNFITFLLVLIPLAWHLEAWNVGCILYIWWVATTCLVNFINLVVWRDNAINSAPIWCDIAIRYVFCARIGIVAAGLVIARRLSKIATGNNVATTRQDKRRAILTDFGIGMFFPVFQLIMFWFYQGHRFDMYEGVGCYVAIPNTIHFQILYSAMPLPMGIASSIYCVITLRSFMRHRKQFSELLASNNNLTFSRYFRLMAMAVIEIVCTVPLTIFVLVVNFTLTPLYPENGLADLHSGFGRVRQYPTAIWLEFGMAETFEINQWIVIACGLLFFMIFGLAEEARKHYRSAYTSVAKRVGLSTGMVDSSGGYGYGSSKGVTSSGFGKGTIPTFVQNNRSKRDSMFSISDRLSTAISLGDFDDTVLDEKSRPYSLHPDSSASSSSGSSTYLPSPISPTDDKVSMKGDDEIQEVRVSGLKELERPKPTLDVEGLQRHTPDVPSPATSASVRNSIDMV